jgi:hypothetical protein
MTDQYSIEITLYGKTAKVGKVIKDLREYLAELSKKYPDVGFKTKSHSPEILEEKFIIDGNLIYFQYLDTEGPNWWLNVTGNEMSNTFSL